MEKFMQRETVFLGLSSPKNSSKTPLRSSGSSEENMDFNDVFGGPPRRFSMQEVRVRCSFGGETAESEEKPAFGEDSVGRRRHQGDDFFDDIFRGDDQSYSSPRRSDIVFGSNPGSRIMSPARPLPPKDEPFGTSLPAQLSLPAKLTKATEYPTFGSRDHIQSGTNGLNNPESLSSLSRFSNQATRQSPLSHEASLSHEDPSSTFTSNQKESIEILKKDTRNVDSIGDQFHFSIYKWAGSGVPMLMPLVAWNSLKSKDKKKDDTFLSSNKHEFLKMKHENEDLRRKEETKEVQNSVEEALSESSPNDTIVSEGAKQSIKEEGVKSLGESGIGVKIEKEVSLKVEESLKPEVKPPGNVTEMEGNMSRTTKEVHANARNTNMKKNKEIKIDSKNASVEKSLHGKSGVKGKVREFVQIFNHEADSRTKADVLKRSQSSRWKAVGVDQKENEVNSNAAKEKEKVNLHDIDKTPDVSIKVDENLKNNEARKISPTKTPYYASSHSSTNTKKSFSSEKLHRDSRISMGNSDDLFFMVEELSDDQEKDTQTGSSEDTRAIDAKIQQWSFGKKGNIRSLLSTLQYVLWDGSGWKPVPLVDLIEANSVKRAYQKALLRLHPDKLQQKGAAFHQKYIAEKVFDILQEAWDHFNTITPL